MSQNPQELQPPANHDDSVHSEYSATDDQLKSASSPFPAGTASEPAQEPSEPDASQPPVNQTNVIASQEEPIAAPPANNEPLQEIAPAVPPPVLLQPPSQGHPSAGARPGNQRPPVGQASMPGVFAPPAPGYGYTFTAPVRKTPAWVWIVISILGGTLLLFCAACGLGGLAVASIVSSASRSNVFFATPTVAEVGKTNNAVGVKCTLYSVKVLPDDSTNLAGPNKEYIVIHVKIHNTSSQEIAYSLDDFQVITSNGVVLTNDGVTPLTYTDDNQLDSGRLIEDGYIEGDIILQAPDDDAGAKLRWTPEGSPSFTRYEWNIGDDIANRR
ncbi:DUF4352 domain-containing protein [Tengunoibacter tsumagoiensis]|uniref:DUF4352 domain-containing protein n=1 Tax=Tengunoibacter tsumagoiensis TaxID=2014871 RepID=A0A402A9P4_9CHLR|nr:DUF4352 domain-containing protein [Tengunoibacter tsumagoiensis]GCE15882.1 hypothetical protein KTT_57410 [Tengunoibacter tsumagoiensis]